MPYIGFLMAMQAAGSVIDWYDYKNKKKLIGAGRDLEQAAFETNLQALKLESDEASLSEMEQLRKNLGSQIAIQAARGTSTSAGTAPMLAQESIGAFNKDERVRRMNLLAKESQLRAQNVLSGLHTTQSESQLGQEMTKRFIGNLPTSSAVDQFRRSDLAKKWGFGFEPAK